MIGIGKKNLESYIQTVKLGEKYQYPFKMNLDKKINELKKFLKQKSEMKKNQEIEMVAKFKNFYQWLSTDLFVIIILSESMPYFWYFVLLIWPLIRKKFIEMLRKGDNYMQHHAMNKKQKNTH